MKFLLPFLIFVNTALAQFNLLDPALLANASDCATPWILVAPVNQSVMTNENASFTVTAAGTKPLFYHWKTNGVYVTDGGRISGGYSNVLTFTGASLDDTAISCVCAVTNSCGSVDSSAATLTVNAIGGLTNQGYALREITTAEDTNTLVFTNFVCASFGRLLLVQVFWQDASTDCDAVTYAGNSLSLIKGVAIGTSPFMRVYGLANAPASGHILVHMTGNCRVIAGAVAYSGTSLVTPWGTADGNVSVYDTVSLSFTNTWMYATNASAVGELVANFCALTYWSSSLRPSTAMTWTNYVWHTVSDYEISCAQTNGAASVESGWVTDGTRDSW